MTLRIIWIFWPFLTGTPILHKFLLKNQNCLFKSNFVKLDVDTQVCCFWLETILWSKFCLLTLKFVTYNNSNILNSMVMFTFAVFDWKRPFRAILVHKISFLFLSLIWYRGKFEYVELDYGARFFSVFEPEISILVKPVLNYQSCYIFFKLFSLIMLGFCFGKLVTTLRSFMFSYNMKQLFLYFIKRNLVCFDLNNFD